VYVLNIGKLTPWQCRAIIESVHSSNTLVKLSFITGGPRGEKPGTTSKTNYGMQFLKYDKLANKNRMNMTSNGKLYWAQGILKETGSGAALKYLVRWYGYEKHTWEPAANLPEVLIRVFNTDGPHVLTDVNPDNVLQTTRDGLEMSAIKVNLPIRLWVSCTFSHIYIDLHT
jgi:hypothetical protein